MAKVGRPRQPKSEITKWALWKRAQRADPGGGKGMQRHHLDNNYGRTSEKTEKISIADHNRKRKGTKYKVR